MYSETHRTAQLLAPERVSDELFFEATAQLDERLNRHGEHGDLRCDAAAPKALNVWFRHAAERVPDFRVWDLSCQIAGFFDPCSGLALPQSWPWDTRDRVLALNEALRASGEWRGAVEAALLRPGAESVRAIACCAAEQLGFDPYPALWRYLGEHPSDGFLWHLIGRFVDLRRLPAYLRLAREVLHASDAPGGFGRFDEQPDELLGFVGVEVMELLRGFPGHGLDLIEGLLLRGRAIERLRAAEALAAWPEHCILADTRHLIGQVLTDECNEAVRDRLQQLALPAAA